MADHRLVVVNPNAAGIRDETERQRVVAKLRAELERIDGAQPRIVETRDRDEAGPAVAKGLEEGVTGVVGVGGDGTLRDIAAILAGSGVPLGVIPAGTGNQFAAVLGVPLAIDRAIAALDGAQARPADLGEAVLERADGTRETVIFIIGCGVGFDARLMATTPAAWKRRVGKAAYFAQALKLIPHIDTTPYRLTVDGQVREIDASIVLVGNAGQLIPGLLGPRLPLEPGDGMLDLIAVGASNPIRGLRGLADQVWRTELGEATGADSLRLRGASISVEPLEPEPMEVDGDYVGEGRISARVRPAALKVLAPDR